MGTWNDSQMAPRAAGKGHMKDTIHAPRPGTQACPAGLALLVLPFTAAVDRPGAHTAHPSCSSSGITSVVCRRPRRLSPAILSPSGRSQHTLCCVSHQVRSCVVTASIHSLSSSLDEGSNRHSRFAESTRDSERHPGPQLAYGRRLTGF